MSEYTDSLISVLESVVKHKETLKVHSTKVYDS